MPGPKKILPQHTLEAGFRIFYNETVDSVPVTASLMPDGKFRITRFDNSFFEVPLTALFYTKEQINTLLVNLGIEPATSLKAGIAKLSTESDVLAGTNESDIVTPYLLNYLLDLLVGNLPDLLTDDKTSIVAAINELKENGGGISADDLGQGLIISSDKLTLDLESKTLVSPSISVTWTIFKNDGTTPYNPATSNSGGITVDKGCVVNLSSYYSHPVPNSSQASPTGVSGNYPLPLPAPGVNSNTLTVNGITTNQSYNVTLTKPKSGLIVVSNQVQFASGNDATGGGISVSFKVR